jgi:CheY-like chemotaxis protein
MREQQPLRDVPVAFMTAKVQPGEVSHYKSLGALDVIAKPFDPMTLSGRITEIWNSRNG